MKRAIGGTNLIQVRAMESAAIGGGAFLLEHQKHAFSVGRSVGHAHLTGSKDSKKIRIEIFQNSKRLSKTACLLHCTHSRKPAFFVKFHFYMAALSTFLIKYVFDLLYFIFPTTAFFFIF